jgi:hypothetical protein
MSNRLEIETPVTVLAFGKRRALKLGGLGRIVKLNPLVRGCVSVTGRFFSDRRLASCHLQGFHTRSHSMIGGLLAF